MISLQDTLENLPGSKTSSGALLLSTTCSCAGQPSTGQQLGPIFSSKYFPKSRNRGRFNFTNILYYIYSKNGGSQSMSRRFERQKLAAGEKFGAIKSLADPDHKYVSFIVCRDPIEKLLSVYNFMKYQVLENERNQKKKNPPEWQKYFSSRNIPSWKMFLFKLSKGFTGYDGLTDSLINKCSPCHYHYRYSH